MELAKRDAVARNLGMPIRCRPLNAPFEPLYVATPDDVARIRNEWPTVQWEVTDTRVEYLLRINLSLDEAERRYRNGAMSQDDWECFCYLWRNSAPRLSNECLAYHDENYDPADPHRSWVSYCGAEHVIRDFLEI